MALLIDEIQCDEEKSSHSSSMEHCDTTTKSYTNQQKVFACRVVLLAPILCILSVLLVLLVCMEFMGQSSTENINCRTLNCTVQDKNGSLVASCIKDKLGNHTKMTNCLKFKVSCGLESADSEDEKPHENISLKDFRFRLDNVTELFLGDHLLQNGANFVRQLFAKNGALKSCSFDEARTTPGGANVKETPKEKRVKKNTRIAATVFLALLSLGFLAVIVMLMYTRKTLKFCCSMCYQED